MRDAQEIRGQLERLYRHRLLPAIELLAERELVHDQLRELASPLETRQKEANARQTENECQLLEDIEHADIEVLCLKGAALARWLYPKPDQRYRTDLDIMVAHENVDRMLRRLAALGFGQPRWTVWSTQVSLVHPQSRLCIDLHWHLSDHPVFHHLFSFSELWVNSVSLIVKGKCIRRLDAPHALAHAVIHRQVEIGGGHASDAGLLDMFLLTEKMNDGQTARFEAICEEKGISGLAAAALEDAAMKFDIEPATLVDRLRQRGESEWLTTLVTRPRSKLRMAGMAWRAQPGWRERLALCRRFVFPDPQFMRCRHGNASNASLVGQYALRVFKFGKRKRGQ